MRVVATTRVLLRRAVAAPANVVPAGETEANGRHDRPRTAGVVPITCHLCPCPSGIALARRRLRI